MEMKERSRVTLYLVSCLFLVLRSYVHHVLVAGNVIKNTAYFKFGVVISKFKSSSPWRCFILSRTYLYKTKCHPTLLVLINKSLDFYYYKHLFVYFHRLITFING